MWFGNISTINIATSLRYILWRSVGTSVSNMRLRRDGRTTEDLEKMKPVDYSLADVSPDEIKYVLFKHTDPDKAIILTDESVGSLDISLQTKMFLHGWNSSGLASDWYTTMKNAYFSRGPHNIILLDYTVPGTKAYEVSAANTKPVGKHVAEFFLKTKIPLENIHLIGHSLGAHVASFIGKYIQSMSGKKLARITALDTAGPKFECPDLPAKMRLCHEDAEFVDVIHTDIELSGFASPLGHIDFYPNSGLLQPGCPLLDIDDNCSHARSKDYFIESIYTRNSKAQEARISGTGKRLTVEVIDNGKEVIFGDNAPAAARGVYFIETNPKAPFLVV